MCTHFFGAKNCIYILRDVIFALRVYFFCRQKMYTHFKRCYLCIMCTHFFGAKNCIYILRDVIYALRVYFFCRQKMYTHFKRCYLCSMCIQFLAPSDIYIYSWSEYDRERVVIGCLAAIDVVRSTARCLATTRGSRCSGTSEGAESLVALQLWTRFGLSRTPCNFRWALSGKHVVSTGEVICRQILSTLSQVFTFPTWILEEIMTFIGPCVIVIAED